ncbi:MAG: DUF3833 domain-containing protein [Burkholderiales bacterium]|nr:MAG: DUF3833 domain-containing protein [Burkholderiales bacterium]
MLRRILMRLVAAAGALALTAGCSSADPQVYAREKPALDLQRYFDGTLTGHGLFMDRSGQVQRRFVVTIKASWDGDVGTLDEDFLWSDGEKERRVWTLRPVPGQPGRWSGTAADVKGEAVGVVAGNALNWSYTFMLRTREGKRYEIDFDDWMFLIDEKVMLNRAVMTFWGFRVGEVLISFARP